jgi:hypothetical protein
VLLWSSGILSRSLAILFRPNNMFWVYLQSDVLNFGSLRALLVTIGFIQPVSICSCIYCEIYKAIPCGILRVFSLSTIVLYIIFWVIVPKGILDQKVFLAKEYRFLPKIISSPQVIIIPFDHPHHTILPVLIIILIFYCIINFLIPLSYSIILITLVLLP